MTGRVAETQSCSSSHRAVDLCPVDLHLVDEAVAGRVVPPPADALEPVERSRMADREPLSLLRVLGPEGQDGATAGRLAGERLRELVAAGRYHHRGRVLAVHELQSPEHRQIGLIGGIGLDDVRQGLVLPHEQTRQQRESRLAAFLGAAGMDVSPVILTHRAEPAVDEVIAEVIEEPPDLRFEGWGEVHHRVWIIDDPEHHERLRDAVGSITQLTIIDGHHRVAAALGSSARGPHASSDGDRSSASGGEEGTLLAELVAGRDLRMVGFDRRIKVGDRADAERILDRLSEVGVVEELGGQPLSRPDGPHEMLAATGGRWVRVSFTDPPDSVPDSLPVTLLQDRVLGPIVGITDPRTDGRLEHVPGLGGLDELDRSLRDAPTVAFVPRAVTVSELQEVASRHRVLPPKSTYVDPKPGPGVVLRLRDRRVGMGS